MGSKWYETEEPAGQTVFPQVGVRGSSPLSSTDGAEVQKPRWGGVGNGSGLPMERDALPEPGGRSRDGGRHKGVNQHIDQVADGAVELAHADQHAF